MMKFERKKMAAILTSAALAVGSICTVPAAEETAEAPAHIMFDLEVGDSDLLSSLTGTDFSWLESLVLDIDADASNPSMVAERISPTLNGAYISDIFAYVDMETLETYVQCPELSDQMIKVDVSALAAESGVAVGGVMMGAVNPAAAEEISGEMAALASEYPQEFMDQYVSPFFAAFQEKSAIKGVSVDGQETAVNFEGVSISLEDGLEILADDLEKMKSDETLAEIMEASGTPWEETLDEAITALISLNEDGSLTGINLNLMMGSTEDGSVLSGYAELDMDSMQMQLADFTVQMGEEGLDGSARAGMEGAEAQITFSVVDTTYHAVLSVNGEDMAEADMELGEEGSITLTSGTEGLAGFGLVINYAQDSVDIALVYEGSDLISLNVETGEGEAVAAPDAAALENALVSDDEEAMNTFLQTLDQEKLMEQLSNAGLGELLGAE